MPNGIRLLTTRGDPQHRLRLEAQLGMLLMMAARETGAQVRYPPGSRRKLGFIAATKKETSAG